eukprot:1239066-Pleurochrysis_carterae.AAC.1
MVSARREAARGNDMGRTAAPQATTTPPTAQRSLRDLPAGSTSKLAQLRAETGVAARRAADAAVLQPLCELDTLSTEAVARPQEGAVASVARLVAQPGYGEAAWAAIFSNG